MIKVNVSDYIIEINGHSNYDIVGKDIVCSAVSSIVITTINGIISINKDAIKYNYHNDKMIITIVSDDQVTRKLLDNMVEMLKSLVKDYPQNIMVKEK